MLFFGWRFAHIAGDESSSDNEESGHSKVTLAYQSKRTSEREGLQDMGATLTLETESTTTKVKGYTLHTKKNVPLEIHTMSVCNLKKWKEVGTTIVLCRLIRIILYYLVGVLPSHFSCFYICNCYYWNCCLFLDQQWRQEKVRTNSVMALQPPNVDLSVYTEGKVQSKHLVFWEAQFVGTTSLISARIIRRQATVDLEVPCTCICTCMYVCVLDHNNVHLPVDHFLLFFHVFNCF